MCGCVGFSLGFFLGGGVKKRKYKDTSEFLVTLTLSRQACSMLKYFGQLKHVNSVYVNSECLPALVADRLSLFSLEREF